MDVILAHPWISAFFIFFLLLLALAWSELFGPAILVRILAMFHKPVYKLIPKYSVEFGELRSKWKRIYHKVRKEQKNDR